MTIPRHIRKQLPKAKLITVRRGGWYFKPYWAKFRCANFMQLQCPWFVIIVRMPYLEDAARQSYPHLFK